MGFDGMEKGPVQGKSNEAPPKQLKPPSREEIRAALLQRAAARKFAENSGGGAQEIYLDPKKQALKTELEGLKAIQSEADYSGNRGRLDDNEMAGRIQFLQEQLADGSAKIEKPKSKVVLSGELAQAAETQRAIDKGNAFLEGANREAVAQAIGVPGRDRSVDLGAEIAKARQLNQFLAKGMEGDATRVENVPPAPVPPAKKPSILSRLFGKQ